MQSTLWFHQKVKKLFVSSFTIAYEVSCRARKEEVSRVSQHYAPV